MDNLAMKLDVDSSKGISDGGIAWQLVGGLEIFEKLFDAGVSPVVKGRSSSIS